jgi:hypothetical protein
MLILASQTNSEEAAAVASSLFIYDCIFYSERRPQTARDRGTCCTHPLYMPTQFRAQSEPQSRNLFTFFVKKILGLVA